MKGKPPSTRGPVTAPHPFVDPAKAKGPTTRNPITAQTPYVQDAARGKAPPTGPRGPATAPMPLVNDGPTGEDAWIYNRWISAIEERAELRTVFRKGKVLARKGAVNDLQIRQGLLSAEVASDSGESHSVKIRMDPIDGPTWVSVVEAISQEAALAADLIRGRLSEHLADIFEEAGHDLFPFDLRDVSSYCSCREDSKVCTGAVATHIHFAEVIQSDPMKLLAFRGRDKQWLEDEVRERRGGGPAPAKSPQKAVPGAPKKPEVERKAERRPEPRIELIEPAINLKDGFWQKSELPNLNFNVGEIDFEDDETFPVVRALGPGPGDLAPDELASTFFPVLRASRLKIEHTLNRVENESEAPPPEGEEVPESEPLDDLLLAAARQQGQLTTGMVAQALGVSPREAREYLQYLVDKGALVMQGKARGTKYIPAELAATAPAQDVTDPQE